MNAPDTCIFARWILRDDEAQAEAADAILARPFRLGVTVLLELGWLLRSRGGMSRRELSEVLATVVSLPSASVEQEANVRWAIERYATSGDWADLMHLAAATEAESLLTFDQRLEREAGRNAPLPVQVIRT